MLSPMFHAASGGYLQEALHRTEASLEECQEMVEWLQQAAEDKVRLSCLLQLHLV